MTNFESRMLSIGCTHVFELLANETDLSWLGLSLMPSHFSFLTFLLITSISKSCQTCDLDLCISFFLSINENRKNAASYRPIVDLDALE